MSIIGGGLVYYALVVLILMIIVGVPALSCKLLKISENYFLCLLVFTIWSIILATFVVCAIIAPASNVVPNIKTELAYSYLLLSLYSFGAYMGIKRIGKLGRHNGLSQKATG